MREAHVVGNIVAVLQLGCLTGSLAATLTADKLGRKWSIVLAALIFTIGGGLQITGMDLDMLYVGRFIAGLGVGGLSMLVPVYVAEIAHPSQRGMLGGLWQFFIAAGLALSYWTNYIVQRLIDDPMDNALWRVPLTVQVVPGVIMMFGMFALFETPRYLIAHNQYKQALQVLCRIRNWPLTDPRLVAEADQIRTGIMCEAAAQKHVGWRAIVAKPNRRRLLVGLSLQALQQMTGTNVINYYSPVIFRSIGLSSNTSELLATGVYGLIKMSMVLLGFSCLVDRWGRRKLLMCGGIAMGICMLAVAICVGTLRSSVLDRTAEDSQVFQPGSYAASAYMNVECILYAVFFVLSWGPIPWIYCSEIYPMTLRAKSTALTTTTNWVFNAIVGKFSPLLLAKSVVGTYIFFGLLCVFNAIYCFFWVPETKGMTLEEIQTLFEASSRSPRLNQTKLLA
ncbi:general substrate transporter [Dichotomocladium elegans]|nr:general substrate transporter [Dichotomocladium elegans]